MKDLGGVLQMKKKKFSAIMFVFCFLLIFTAACSSTTSTDDSKGEGDNNKAESIKIGVLASTTGALEAYGKQSTRGFELGLDYATNGTMEVAGKKIEFIIEDTETNQKLLFKKQPSY